VGAAGAQSASAVMGNQCEAVKPPTLEFVQKYYQKVVAGPYLFFGVVTVARVFFHCFVSLVKHFVLGLGVGVV
jgi:hypothetical protein